MYSPPSGAFARIKWKPDKKYSLNSTVQWYKRATDGWKAGLAQIFLSISLQGNTYFMPS
jgi:hypothetical protein